MFTQQRKAVTNVTKLKNIKKWMYGKCITNKQFQMCCANIIMHFRKRCNALQHTLWSITLRHQVNAYVGCTFVHRLIKKTNARGLHEKKPTFPTILWMHDALDCSNTDKASN